MDKIPGVERVSSAEVRRIERQIRLSFDLPLKTTPKANLNVPFGKGRLSKKTGRVRERPWYEVEVIVSKSITKQKGYPFKREFVITTDDGYRFPCKTSGDNSKNFRSEGGLVVLGTWIKGRMEAAGSLKVGELVTPEHLEHYGRDHITLSSTPDPDMWFLDFRPLKTGPEKNPRQKTFTEDPAFMPEQLQPAAPRTAVEPKPRIPLLKPKHFESYLERTEELRPGLAAHLRPSVEEFVSEHLEPFPGGEHSMGLILGHVQSGKTAHILGTAAAGADLGFKIFILLTTDNILLQEQTLERAESSLKTFDICNETDDTLLRKGDLHKPVLLVLKKNSKVLRTWRRHLASFSACAGETLVVLDDEGDAASLNTRVNQDEVSTIHGLLDGIRRAGSGSVYLQVTATPQAPLLQTIISDWRPDFVFCLKPGSGYLGGDFFYGEDSKCRALIAEDEAAALLSEEETPEGYQRAIVTFLLTCACLKKAESSSTCCFLVHPSLNVADHETVERKTRAFLGELAHTASHEPQLLEELSAEALEDLARTKGGFPPFEALRGSFTKAVNNCNVIVLNQNTPADIDYSEGFNILIGGNSLGRGVTFPALQTVYYCRSTKVPQADTMWQHSRMFGYDRDGDLCRVFLPPRLSNHFRKLTEANNALFKALAEKGVEGLTLLTPEGMRPTRPSVLDRSALDMLVGGVNYFPASPASRRTKKLDLLLGPDDDDKTISLDEAIKILSLTSADHGDENKLKTYISCIETLQAAGGTECRLMVRTDRNIQKGTGTLLSPNDRKKAMQIKDRTVLVLYRLNGQKDLGWNGRPLWAPNIKFPAGTCFYASGLTP